MKNTHLWQLTSEKIDIYSQLVIPSEIEIALLIFVSIGVLKAQTMDKIGMF